MVDGDGLPRNVDNECVGTLFIVATSVLAVNDCYGRLGAADT